VVSSDRDFVDNLEACLRAGGRIIFFGASGAGKTTLQLHALERVQDLRQIFVDKYDAPMTSGRPRTHLALVWEDDVDKASLDPNDFDVISHYELKTCGHQWYIERNERPVCSQASPAFVARYWGCGKAGIVTAPVSSGELCQAFGYFSACFAEVARHATHIVNVRSEGPDSVTSRIWELYVSTKS